MPTQLPNSWTAIRAKIRHSTYLELKNYCTREGLTPSEFIRNLIESNVGAVVPVNHAGQNKIEYDKKNDTFSWHVEHDKGPRILIADSLQPTFLENLLKEVHMSHENRIAYIRQSKPDSVPIPTQLKILKGEQ